jgi:hypothetical protein
MFQRRAISIYRATPYITPLEIISMTMVPRTSICLWKKTSFNTVLGKYYITDPVTGIRTLAEDQSKAFRKNCAGIGFSYNEEIDGFVPPKLFTSWLLDSTTGGWYPPVPRPEVQSEDEKYVWNEENTTWDKYINTNLDKNSAPVWEKV